MTNPTPENRFAQWLQEGKRSEGEPIPAATVILVRDRFVNNELAGIETLMLRKNSKLAFGGMWVFPGGRIDDEDREGADTVVEAARQAATREAYEEAGLKVDPASLQWISHWLPPSVTPKRFATWFFVAPAPKGSVKIDDGEIHESEWMSPVEALARRDEKILELAPPTWMTLHYLAQFSDLSELMRDAENQPPTFYETRIAKGAQGIAAMWAGDAGYEREEIDTPGARHRLWLADDVWTIERSI